MPSEKEPDRQVGEEEARRYTRALRTNCCTAVLAYRQVPNCNWWKPHRRKLYAENTNHDKAYPIGWHSWNWRDFAKHTDLAALGRPVGHGATIERLARLLRRSTHRTKHGEFLWKADRNEAGVIQAIALDTLRRLRREGGGPCYFILDETPRRSSGPRRWRPSASCFTTPAASVAPTTQCSRPACGIAEWRSRGLGDSRAAIPGGGSSHTAAATV